MGAKVMLLLDKLPYFAKKKSFFYLILQKTDRRITLFYSKKNDFVSPYYIPVFRRKAKNLCQPISVLL
jgi:hypothetical protein